jgi:hypothetical protein
MGGLLFNWTGVVSALDENGYPLRDEKGRLVVQSDEGVPLSDHSELKVTTPVWEASFALSVDFRQTFLAQIANLQAQSLWSDNLQTLWEPTQISEPSLIEPGKWRVTVVANCIYIDRQSSTRQIQKCNKEFYLQAIDTPPLPIPSQATEVQIASYKARSANLEIFLIKDLEEENP